MKGAFNTEVGRSLIESVSRDFPRYITYVAPEPYALVEPRLVRPPERMIVADKVDQATLDRLVDEAAGTEAVVGIGGGTAIDTAKYVAWKTGARLWQFPSIASVDAVFTQPAGVRVDGRVRYLGSVTPELVAVDLDLVLAAPPGLNRAGVGDILSCHTGLHDWRAAAEAGAPVPSLDRDLTTRAEEWLAAVGSHEAEIAAADEEGVRFLISTLREVGSTCDEVGHSYFEEGSEHYFAYCLEHRTGSRLVHGELVALGIVAMSVAQENEPASIAEQIDRLGVRYRPGELGLDRESVEAVLWALPGFCEEEGFPPSAASRLDGTQVAAILEVLF